MGAFILDGRRYEIPYSWLIGTTVLQRLRDPAYIVRYRSSARYWEHLLIRGGECFDLRFGHVPQFESTPPAFFTGR